MAASGHVNMMDDVLISNLSPVLLRSALRTLVSQGATTQRPFVEHIRKRLQESPPPLTDAHELFPLGSGDDNNSVVSQACLDYIASTRCVFSSKLAIEALPYLTHFVASIPVANTRWTTGDALDRIFDKFSGDIVQAVQALKESKPARTPELLAALQALRASFGACAEYCSSSSSSPLKFPFTRADRQVRDVVGFLYPDLVGALPPTVTGRSPSAAAIQLDLSKRQHVPVETFRLGSSSLAFPRLLNGLWQLSSPAWGSGSAESQEEALAQLVESGLSAADMADHYGDAELIYGDFRNRLPAELQETVSAATKWCIFGPLHQPVTTEFVLDGVRERARRLGGRVELLQFHWYDYAATEYLDILVELVKATKTHPELVATIGLCNFDAEHTEDACKYLLAKTGEVGLVSNQVQFSLLDARPLQKMTAVCEKYGLKLLTYGSFCGGFISPKWLNQPIPEIYSEASQLTPSQRKYFDMLQNWGTWTDFQVLLQTLSQIAQKHTTAATTTSSTPTTIALTDIATRWVLQPSSVGAVIVGTRLGVSTHAADNLNVFRFVLDDEDMEAINRVALGGNGGGERAQAVFDKLGDCGNEYRAMH